jgi:acetyl-CoA carboxylase carboxyltransferase component
MGALQAVSIAKRREIAAGADVYELAALYTSTTLRVDVAAANGLVDEVVAPEATRERLIAELGLHG